MKALTFIAIQHVKQAAHSASGLHLHACFKDTFNIKNFYKCK